jgi:hypothetical protein
MNITPEIRRAMERQPVHREASRIYAKTDTDTRLPTAEQPQPTPALAETRKGKAQGTGRPHVCFTLFRSRLLDWDAKYGVLKDLLDGLVIAQLLPGDREDQITGECNQIKVKSRKDEKTVIEITYP